MPFVQGHLLGQPVSVTIRTQCVHTGQSIQFEVDREQNYRVLEGEKPIIFIPLVDFKKLKDPSIIDAF